MYLISYTSFEFLFIVLYINIISCIDKFFISKNDNKYKNLLSIFLSTLLINSFIFSFK